MLFETALYSLSQILKALGYDVSAGEIIVPDVGELEGQTLIVRGQKKPASTDENGRDVPERFEVKGYQAANVTQKTGDPSILP